MFLIYVIVTLLILTFLVSVHEFGHFIVAKKCGVLVEEYAIGMGPALYQKQGKETLFSIRAIPFGGFCKMRGEQSDDEEDNGPIAENDFRAKSKPQRLAILAAGVTMNFLVGFILIVICYILVGAGFLQTIRGSFLTFGEFFLAIFESFRLLFTGQVSMSDVAGPIGMVRIVGDLYSLGFVKILLFTALLSVNLGVMNLIPVPALDGGQMLIILAEAAAGRELSERARGILIGGSFILLLALMVLISLNDIIQLIGS